MPQVFLLNKNIVQKGDMIGMVPRYCSQDAVQAPQIQHTRNQVAREHVTGPERKHLQTSLTQL